MSDWWFIRIEVWPFSVEDAAKDQKAAGDRVFRKLIQAPDIKGALKVAEMYAEGIAHNPRVWQTPITHAVQYRGEIRGGLPCNYKLEDYE